MGLSGIREVINCELEGRVRNFTWRKTPSQVTTSGLWFDTSLSPGMPPPQYYIGTPLKSTALKQSTDGGLYHGPDVSPNEKFIRSITVQASAGTALPMNAILCDYLMFYPFIDQGTIDPQPTNFGVASPVTLPRYTDGKGVQAIAVATNAGGGTAPQFFFEYTNSDGVSGRISQIVTMNTSLITGNILGSNTAVVNATNPFIGLQLGDDGIRTIDSVTMLGIETGLFCLCLVKPLVQHCFKESGIPYEKDYLIPTTQVTKVFDDAFLGFLTLPLGTLAATALTGNLKVIWG